MKYPFIELIPAILKSHIPSVYEGESYTSLEYISKVAHKMNEVVSEVNNFAKSLVDEVENYKDCSDKDIDLFKRKIEQMYDDFINTCKLQFGAHEININNTFKEWTETSGATITSLVLAEFDKQVGERTAEWILENSEQIEHITEEYMNTIYEASASAVNRITTEEENAKVRLNELVESCENIKEEADTAKNETGLLASKAETAYNDTLKLSKEVEENTSKVESLVEEFENDNLPDWLQNDETKSSHIRNRTHWKVPGDIATTLLDKTVTFSGGFASVTEINESNIIPNKEYNVTFNGTVYKCTAVLYGSVMLGNLSLLSSGDDTGEPFCFECYSTSATLKTNSTLSGTKTVKVETVATPDVYHKIPIEYLPDNIGSGGSGSGSTPIIFTTSDMETITCNKTFEECKNDINNNQLNSYLIIFGTSILSFYNIENNAEYITFIGSFTGASIIIRYNYQNNIDINFEFNALPIVFTTSDLANVSCNVPYQVCENAFVSPDNLRPVYLQHDTTNTYYTPIQMNKRDNTVYYLFDVGSANVQVTIDSNENLAITTL